MNSGKCFDNRVGINTNNTCITFRHNNMYKQCSRGIIPLLLFSLAFKGISLSYSVAELCGIMVSVIIRLCRNEETIELWRQAPTLEFLHQVIGWETYG